MDNVQLHEASEELRDEPKLSTADLVSSSERGNNRAIPVRASEGNGAAPLFVSNEAETFRSRWEKIQIGFVDEPRNSVVQADELVATVIKRLAEVFAEERNTPEHEWAKGDNVSTEDLRVALRRYRSFFDRLLSV